MKEADEGVKWFYTKFLPKTIKAKSVRMEDGVLPRLREPVINLFTPWGPRYSWESRGVEINEGDKEVETIAFLRSVLDSLLTNMANKQLHWMFLGADLYGTRLNGLPEEVVSGYYGSLSNWLSRLMPEIKFRLWSEFDTEAERYRCQVREEFFRYIDRELLRRTTQVAQAMGRGSDPKEYLVERVAEALLIEEQFQPVKISCVRKEKDAIVDANLPRIYIVPEGLTAPWK